MHVLCQ